MEWKRRVSGGPTTARGCATVGCAILFAFPFLLVAGLEMGCVVSYYRTTRALVDTPTTLAGPDGPRLLRGEIVVDAPSRSPAGREAAAWIATATRREGRSTRRLCQLEDMAPSQLSVDGRRVPLALLDGVRIAAESSVVLRNPVLIQLPDTVSSPAPPSFVERCKADGQDFDPAAATYEESVLPPWAPVSVRACLREGAVVPCDDGLDAVSARSPRELRDLIHSSRSFVHHGVLWTSFVLAFCCGAALLLTGARVRATLASRSRSGGQAKA